MSARSGTQRLPSPPTVHVPTREPAASPFSASHILWGGTRAVSLRQTSLSEHHGSKRAGISSLSNSNNDHGPEEENFIKTIHLDELARTASEKYVPTGDVANHTSAPVTGFAGIASPAARSLRTSSPVQRTPCPSSATRRNSTTRPPWNRRHPAPRAKPIVSDPRTEPRRLTRSSSARAQGRPWLDGIGHSNDSGAGVNANKIDGNNVTSMLDIQLRSGQSLASCKRTLSVDTAALQRAISVNTRKMEKSTALSPQMHLDFVRTQMLDAQRRAVRAEARCEELEVMFHALQQDHYATKVRLEEQYAQLSARMEYLLTLVENATDGPADAPMGKSFSPSSSPPTASNGSSSTVQRDVNIKGTSLRIPPRPPMALKFEQLWDC
ncbi:hypothetical protein TRVL_04061 [Trypanosoma vivax]|uniref:Uncharacterized protein n=1 Tax=Trypanosoma vivax (strain Y486) TaxID=1055687 RepID=G0TS22_TRYVY|nr:hypothetical protein TRVL_04061 [Trypanosoma vivax]CCC46746.1 conserved hypothetical protein [Trypanosoma vivax Y486]